VAFDFVTSVSEEPGASLFGVKVNKEKKWSGHTGRHFLRPFGRGKPLAASIFRL